MLSRTGQQVREFSSLVNPENLGAELGRAQLRGDFAKVAITRLLVEEVVEIRNPAEAMAVALNEADVAGNIQLAPEARIQEERHSCVTLEGPLQPWFVDHLDVHHTRRAFFIEQGQEVGSVDPRVDVQRWHGGSNPMWNKRRLHRSLSPPG